MPRVGADLGFALEQSLRYLAGDVYPGGRCCAGKNTALDTYCIWQDGQRLTKEPLQIVDGKITVPAKPALGIDADMDAIEAAHQLYLSKGLGVRNDAIAMQYFFADWKFDNKRPGFDR